MNTRMILGTRKGLFTVKRQGSGAWSIVDVEFLGAPVTMMLFDRRDRMLYVALNHGHFGVKLHRSAQEGGPWEECACPAYPERPAGWIVDDSKPGSNAPWTTVQIWSLEAGGDDREGRVWAGTIPGGLFFSEDRGDSWHFVRSLWDCPERLEWFGGGYDHAGIHSICVNPRNSQQLIVGVSCGGIWVTEDGGDRWRCRGQGMWAAYMPPEQRETPHIQDPHRLVHCPAQPDCLWVQHHNGIFRSVNGGRLWQEVKEAGPSTFGFAVAVHPKDPNVAWFVPATKDECRVPVDGRFVVTRTRDGGHSFDVLDDGLPQESAYDIVYRHALAVDDSGNLLAVGSTTGGLWVSEDQGDSWSDVSAHLPPVYCVSFVEEG